MRREFLGEPFSKIKRHGPVDKFGEEIRPLALEFRGVLRVEIFLLQFLRLVYQGFRHVTSAYWPKWPVVSGRFKLITALMIKFSRIDVKGICCLISNCRRQCDSTCKMHQVSGPQETSVVIFPDQMMVAW